MAKIDPKKTDAKKEEPKAKKPVSLHTKGESSIIYREGLPFIMDKTENAVKWLAEKGYKEKDIELVGEKPTSWDSTFLPVTQDLTQAIATELDS
jgi:hypothetical protein